MQLCPPFCSSMAKRELAFCQEVAQRPILEDVIVDSFVVLLLAVVRWHYGQLAMAEHTAH